MNSSLPPLLASSTPAWRRSLRLTVKLLSIGILLAVLAIPLALTDGVRREREGIRNEATTAVAALWGQRQLVSGPVLAIPYAYRVTTPRSTVVGGKVVWVDESKVAEAMAYFLPETFSLNGTLEPEIRHRGIFEVAVYLARLRIEARFQPDFTRAGIAAETVHWDRAELRLAVSDLRGLRSISTPVVDRHTVAPFETDEKSVREGWALAAKVSGLAEGASFTVGCEAALQGTDRLDVAPAGKSTRVSLASTWRDPSFGGAYLPAARKVTAAGFQADWEVSHYSRGFGQTWTVRDGQAEDGRGRLAAAGFGVGLSQPSDGYRLVDRALKYGELFYLMIFVACFLFEIIAQLRIHPLQYLMVGAALGLFFLAFLALSEFWPVGPAYAGAAAACTLLITLYSYSFLGAGGRTLGLGAGLAATYGCLYLVLRAQDYALAAGTLTLFAMLALVMFCTRRVNWYESELPDETAAVPAR